MFGKFKQWLGIENVKIRLNVLDAYPKTVTTLNGELEITSNQEQKITMIIMRLIEIYARGRGDEQRIDEYPMGTWQLEEEIWVDKNHPQRIPFQMPFEFVQSNIETFADKNFLFKGIAGIAKSLKGVRSDFQVEVQAVVEGTKFQPFDKAKIKFV